MTTTVLEFGLNLEAGARQLAADLRRELVAAALVAEAEAKQNATTTLNVRSGRLRRSIQGFVEDSPEGPVLKLRAGGGAQDVKYARIHELGGIVRAKNGPFLAIPLGPAKTAAGVARYATARDMPGLALAQSKDGQYMLVKGATGEAAFLLRQQVTIPARPYLRPALDIAMDRLRSRLGATVAAAAGAT